jgi:hypothetical protein
MVSKNDDQQPAQVRDIPVRWPEGIEGMPTSYANHLFISHAGPEFFLIFGVVTPPPILPGEKYEIEDMEALPVAKIAVSPEVMIRMAGAIQDNVQKYMEIRDLREKEVFSSE